MNKKSKIKSKILCACYLSSFCCKDLDSGRVWDCQFKGDWEMCDKPDARAEEEKK